MKKTKTNNENHGRDIVIRIHESINLVLDEFSPGLSKKGPQERVNGLKAILNELDKGEIKWAGSKKGLIAFKRFLRADLEATELFIKEQELHRKN